MKLDNPKPKAIYITTKDEFSINGIILQKQNAELKINIDETQIINEKQIFLTSDIAKAFVESGLAIFDYQKEKSDTEDKKTKNENKVKNENTNKA